MQKEITAAGREKQTLLDFLNDLSSTDRPLNMVNIATILHRTGKARLHLPARITCYLTGKLQGLDHREKMKAMEVGNALYGLKCMSDSEEVRQLVAALTEKVQRCAAHKPPAARARAKAKAQPRRHDPGG